MKRVKNSKKKVALEYRLTVAQERHRFKHQPHSNSVNKIQAREANQQIWVLQILITMKHPTTILYSPKIAPQANKATKETSRFSRRCKRDTQCFVDKKVKHLLILSSSRKKSNQMLELPYFQAHVLQSLVASRPNQRVWFHAYSRIEPEQNTVH